MKVKHKNRKRVSNSPTDKIQQIQDPNNIMSLTSQKQKKTTKVPNNSGNTKKNPRNSKDEKTQGLTRTTTQRRNTLQHPTWQGRAGQQDWWDELTKREGTQSKRTGIHCKTQAMLDTMGQEEDRKDLQRAGKVWRWGLWLISHSVPALCVSSEKEANNNWLFYFTAYTPCNHDEHCNYSEWAAYCLCPEVRELTVILHYDSIRTE